MEETAAGYNVGMILIAVALLAMSATLVAGGVIGYTKSRTATERLFASVVIVGGAAFVGHIDPQPPLLPLLIVPCAPLALWACVYGPLGRLDGIKAHVAQTVAVVFPLVVTLVLLLLREES